MGCNTSKSASVESKKDGTSVAKQGEQSNGEISCKSNGQEAKCKAGDDSESDDKKSDVKEGQSEGDNKCSTVDSEESSASTVTEERKDENVAEKSVSESSQQVESSGHKVTPEVSNDAANNSSQPLPPPEQLSSDEDTQKEKSDESTVQSSGGLDGKQEEEKEAKTTSASIASAPCLPGDSVDSSEATVETRPVTAIRAVSDAGETGESASKEISGGEERAEERMGETLEKHGEECVELLEHRSKDASVKISNIMQSVSTDTAGDTHSDMHDAVSLSVHPATAGTQVTIDSKTEGSRASPMHEPEVLTVQTPPTSADSLPHPAGTVTDTAVGTNVQGNIENVEKAVVHAAS